MMTDAGFLCEADEILVRAMLGETIYPEEISILAKSPDHFDALGKFAAGCFDHSDPYKNLDKWYPNVR